MIHITSEGSLFTPFCNSVVGTANFHQLTVTALIQFSIQSFYFCWLIAIFLQFKKKKKKKKKKTVLQDHFYVVFVCHINCMIVFQWFELKENGTPIWKAIRSGG